MRSVVVLGVVALFGACYAPHAATGAPCSPTAPVCPEMQACKPAVGGGYACTDGDGGSGSASIDAPLQPIDARIDGAPLVPWKLVQSAASVGGALDVMPTSGGDLMIVAVETNANGPLAGITDDAGSNYVRVPNGRATHESKFLSVELWYARDVHDGATTITLDGVHTSVVAWEVSGIRSTGPIDAVATVDDQAASMTPSGAPITTTARGDFVVSVIIVANSIDHITGTTFTNDHTTFGNGWAHLADDDALPGTYQAQWAQPTMSESCAATAAFFAGS